MWGREAQRRLAEALEELDRVALDLDHIVAWFAAHGGLIDGAIQSMNVHREWTFVQHDTVSPSASSGFWVPNLPVIEGFTTSSGLVEIQNTMSLQTGAGTFGIRVKDLTRNEILIDRSGRGVPTENPFVTTAGISGRRTANTRLSVPAGTMLRIEQHLRSGASSTSVGSSDLIAYSIPQETS